MLDWIGFGDKMSVTKPYAKGPWVGALIFLCIIWTLCSLELRNSMRLVTVSERPLILFAYSESESARVNIKFFIAHALHGAADFVFILNGPTDVADIIPKESNIRIVQRANDCYDLGAYSEVLLKDDLYKGYKKFIMLNASIRGPFIPYWSNACWSDMYLGKLTQEVKLVGMTGNCWPTFHIQSMILATDAVGMNVLLFPPPAAAEKLKEIPPYGPMPGSEEMFPQPHPGINSCFHTWGSAVSAEIGSSAIIKAAGYRLDVMMSAYHGVKGGEKLYEDSCDTSVNGDVLEEDGYFGTNVHPYETVFMKTNRKIDPLGIAKLTEWTEGRGYSSYDYCKP
ncbi:hypothetical protein B0O99DRAFT_648905 [Bisporella sp. PMI_857]|nr:hypothetical protein B0O99DRAFT_648905 [Bisporella sp. PMI_857]